MLMCHIRIDEGLGDRKGEIAVREGQCIWTERNWQTILQSRDFQVAGQTQAAVAN